MEIEHRYLLYKIIENNGNINLLVDLGYTYSEILDLIKIEKENNFFLIKKNSFILSEKGIKELNVLKSKLNIKNEDSLITPLYSELINNTNSKNILFIPDQNDLPD